MNTNSATSQEIFQQPKIWRQQGEQINAIRTLLQHRFKNFDHKPGLNPFDHIWFLGAGSSDYIGQTMAAALARSLEFCQAVAIPTTNLLADRWPYFSQVTDKSRLLAILIGRSGDSPETIGCAQLLDKYAPEAARLHVTCNADSFLAKTKTGRSHAIILPPETNDRGFAMTSSFTTMYLTLMACFDSSVFDKAGYLYDLADAAESCLSTWPDQVKKIPPPQRVVFLGSGVLYPAAREGALKVLELSAGKIATMAETPLGFRHGPKAFINEKTKIFLLASPNTRIAPYENDLFTEIQRQYGANVITRIGPDSVPVATHLASSEDFTFPLVENASWSVPLYLVAAQLLAVQWSEALGLNVDNPFQDGKLTRVVGGVTLYTNQ
ncbi:MAG: SIS domain-containing protein [Candidatus Symbiobacter sp.]|nr:SIS domain-containing protein [Candidatus Symbiobacter sp.]